MGNYHTVWTWIASIVTLYLAVSKGIRIVLADASLARKVVRHPRTRFVLRWCGNIFIYGIVPLSFEYLGSAVHTSHGMKRFACWTLFSGLVVLCCLTLVDTVLEGMVSHASLLLETSDKVVAEAHASVRPADDAWNELETALKKFNEDQRQSVKPIVVGLTKASVDLRKTQLETKAVLGESVISLARLGLRMSELLVVPRRVRLRLVITAIYFFSAAWVGLYNAVFGS